MSFNVRATFQKYSDPDAWLIKKHACINTLVPDEILEPVLATLQSHAPGILGHAYDLTQQSLKAGETGSWSWPQTLSFTQDVWNDLNPAYGQRIAQAIDDSDFLYLDVKYGTGSGYCFSDYLAIARDGSINDPVCTVHESGHLMSWMLAPDKYNSEPADNIKELQAMFIQEHAYARLAAQVRDDTAFESVRLHRLAYYTGILSSIPLYLHMLGECSKKPRRTLAQEFSDWSVNPCILSFLSRQYEDSDEADRKHPRRLHKHSFAAIMAPTLYQIFQEKEDQDRQKILSVLYEGGPQTRLRDVLSAFDIETPEDVRRVAERTCQNFKTEIAACNLTTLSSISLNYI